MLKIKEILIIRSHFTIIIKIYSQYMDFNYQIKSYQSLFMLVNGDSLGEINSK
jgi:hypothetical protein